MSDPIADVVVLAASVAVAVAAWLILRYPPGIPRR